MYDWCNHGLKDQKVNFAQNDTYVSTLEGMKKVNKNSFLGMSNLSLNFAPSNASLESFYVWLDGVFAKGNF